MSARIAPVVTSALPDLERYLTAFPGKAHEAARIAINYAADGPALKLLRAGIQAQIAFPTGYLNDPSKIRVSSHATNANLVASVSTRQRATSLARFAAAAYPQPKGTPLAVTVRPGHTETLKGAFLVRLRRGASVSEDNFNVGLAVRLKPGDSLRNVKSGRTVQLDKNLFLLYGPSIDQVFDEVAEEQSDAIGSEVASEFTRQLARLT